MTRSPEFRSIALRRAVRVMRIVRLATTLAVVAVAFAAEPTASGIDGSGHGGVSSSAVSR